MICFAILAHTGEDVLINQLENLRKFVPGSKAFLYNGGDDPSFGLGAGIEICPYSRKLAYDKLGRVLFDMMRWLEERQESYEFLVYLESDVMFVRPGYESFLRSTMSGYDGMEINLAKMDVQTPYLQWVPAKTMWNEWWEIWFPFFRTDYFVGCLNAMQVYRKSMVQKMLDCMDPMWLEQQFARTNVFALEEILYGTLAAKCGGMLRPYPEDAVRFVRLGLPLSVEEVVEAKEHVYFVHPIERRLDNPARSFISDC